MSLVVELVACHRLVESSCRCQESLVAALLAGLGRCLGRDRSDLLLAKSLSFVKVTILRLVLNSHICIALLHVCGAGRVRFAILLLEHLKLIQGAARRVILRTVMLTQSVYLIRWIQSIHACTARVAFYSDVVVFSQ